MNTRMNLIKTTLMLFLATAVMMPVAFHMSANVPKDDGKAILDSLIRHEEYKRTAMSTPIEPMKDIEEIWELEDTRTESEDLLVHTMYLDEYELGFDKQSDTFYCSLGLGATEWPELSLYAVGDEKLHVVWVDDYAYDYREDAVRNGYSYQLFAYTDTSYSYFNLVFTGLPIVTLHVESDEEIGEEYIPARATVFGQGFDAIDSIALVHTRGAGSHRPIEKESYRIEFYTANSSRSNKKDEVNVLGMGADSDWLLMANATDETAVRNYLAFDLWRRWNPDGALTALESRMAELFVNNEYVGLYQVMQRVSPKREIAKAGGNIDTDCVVKVVTRGNKSEKMIVNLLDRMNICAEYQYEPHGDELKVFENLEHYVLLNQSNETVDDQMFADLAGKHLDAEDMMSYYLFLQAGILSSDNVYNNHFIWMFWENGRYVYKLSPWDMDRGLSEVYLEDGSLDIRFARAPVAAYRMLQLNLMDSRNIIRAIWKQKRETILADYVLEAWIMSVEEEMNSSGAYLRESEKWYGIARELNLTDRVHFMHNQMQVIEEFLDYLWPVSDEKTN